MKIIHLKLTEDDHRDLKLTAAQEGITMQKLATKVLDSYMKKVKK